MQKNKIALVIQGGAGPDSKTIQNATVEHEAGLEMALNAGYKILEEGGTAVEAVQTAVAILEDNPLFNAGKGSAHNIRDEVEMCAAIMNGENLKSGGVVLVNNIKNPCILARAVMESSQHILLGGAGAEDFARQMNIKTELPGYFTPGPEIKTHGTVGAVACDQYGNLAACTSTGGMDGSYRGRVADSGIAGAGVYANNKTCAVSATGEGEYILQHSLSFHLHALVEFNNMRVDEAAAYLIYQKLKAEKNDLGLIAVDNAGTISMAFNSMRMHRGWKTSDGDSGIRIYREE